MKKLLLIFIPFLILFHSCKKDAPTSPLNSSSNLKTIRLVVTITVNGKNVSSSIVYSNENGGTSQEKSKSLDKSFKASSGTNISLSASCASEVIYNSYGLISTYAYGKITLKIYVDGNIKADGQNEKSSSTSVNVSASCSVIVP